ncbi:hypothetical protein ABT368_04545 [Streptomyces althioticus]|uniref:hypothetical protein n=1 Tax=Streptomyces TaxID=1883 RepID=UPI00187560FD|nr:hypothetical protein GCM10010243_10200 [Streptomyces matensis]
MSGSVKPRRPRAAAPALRYERPSRVSGATRRKRGDALFGGFVLLAAVGCAVLFAFLESELGDSTWRWAADRPGGAYGFAGFLGVAGPLVAVLCARSLMRMPWTSWRRQRGRAVRIAGTAAASAVALVVHALLVFNAQDTGKWGKGPDGPPSWVFRHHPWLWGVGLSATLLTCAALACVALLRFRHGRRRTPGSGADTTGV